MKAALLGGGKGIGWMGITISFTMEPKMAFLGARAWDGERTEKFAKSLGRELGYHCDVVSGYVIYQLCPEGFLWMAWKGKQLSGDCQTNIVGPGFHGAVIHFLELFAARGELRLYVKDPTGYYADRDFERMTREYFYPWFKRLLSGMISNPRVLAGEPVCWPSDYFVPEPRNGMVMTHIRSFSIRELTGIVRSGLTAPFAKEFFIWNEEEKDAWYFRNCALVLLNQQCYFKPSSRSREDRLVNQEVLRLLEKAMQMEPSIPFPEEEYLEVCRLDGHEPVDLSEVNRMVREEPIGCRRGLLYRTIGLMRFAVPGSFLYDMRAQGNSERYYDGESVGWHEYYICAVRTEGHEAAIRQEPFARETVERTESYEERGMQVKIAYYRPSRGNGYGAPRVERAVLIGEQLAWESEKDDGRPEDWVYTIAAQIAYKDQLTIVSISCSGAADEKWAREMIRRVEPAEGR